MLQMKETFSNNQIYKYIYLRIYSMKMRILILCNFALSKRVLF